MARHLIAETTLAGLRPTGVDGNRVLDSWEQITGYLRGLPEGDALAGLFAEPVGQGGGRVLWFADGAGRGVVAFRDLDAERQEAIRAALTGLTERLDSEAARLESSSNAAARLIGETLRRAQQLPGAVEESLYVIDGGGAFPDQPVLVNWSTEPEGAPPPVEPLKEFARRVAPAPERVPAPAPPPEPAPAASAVPAAAPVAAPIPAPVAAVAAATPFNWAPLLWLLLLLLAGGIYYLLLISCGVGSQGTLLNFCPAPVVAAPPPDPLRPDRERSAVLLAELARLEQQLAQAPRCAPPPPPPPVEPPPEQRAETPPPPPPQEEEFDRRMAENQGREGELTVTLVWDTPSDLDLKVGCPNGKMVYFGARSACGGMLDVDANVSAISPSPVENIYFAAGGWSPGTYRVMVQNTKHRGNAPDRFKIRVKKGDRVEIYEGVVSPRQSIDVANVEMR